MVTVIAPSAVEAPANARPLVPSARQVAEAADQPDGSATVAAADVAEVVEDVASGAADVVEVAVMSGFWKSVIASGPPQVVVESPEQGIPQWGELISREAPLVISLVVAVAFARILDTGVLEALGLTEVDTHRDRHRTGSSRSASERPTVGTLPQTAGRGNGPAGRE